MHKVQINSSSFDPESVKKRISHFDEFDNGHVLFSYSKMSVADSEEKAKQASINHLDDVYYVSYDDLMNSCSDTYWFQGVAYDNAGAWEALRNYRKSGAGLNSGRRPLNSSEEQVKVSGIVTIYSDFVDFKRSVSERLLQTAVSDRAKLKFKWVDDNKVEVRAICSVADERKVKLLLENSEVTKAIVWSNSSNSSKRLNSSLGQQIWYHVSPHPIDSFDVSGSKEIGLHCGITPESGLCRYPKGTIYKVTVTPGIRCAELPDEIEFWASFETPKLLQKAGYADDKAVENLTAKLQAAAGDSDKNRKYSKIIRDYLLSLGYSAFTYTNTKEVKERCICILDSAVVQDMRDVTADYNSHIKPESQFQAPTDAAIFFHDAGYSDERVERELKDAGYSDRYIQRVLDVLGELASAESDDTLNSSIRTNSNRKVGNSSMRKVIFRGKLNSSRKRMNSSRRKLNSSRDAIIKELEEYFTHDEAVEYIDSFEQQTGAKVTRLATPDEAELYDGTFWAIKNGVEKLWCRGNGYWYECKEDFDSSRKRMNSSRRKLNSSEDGLTADVDVQDTGIDGGDTATETAELLDDALIVQNPETKEVSLFVATEDAEVLPESVDIIAEVTPVVESAVLDSSRRLKRFTAAELNSSKGCLNSDAEDVCPACGNPVSECTCEPGTIAYDEIQLPDDTVVEVENILVVQGEDDDLGLFLPETADEAVPDEYEVVAVAKPVAEAEVLDSSRCLKK